MLPSSVVAGLGAAALLLAGAAPVHAVARTLVVHEGESIRAALARASAGDRIEVIRVAR